MEEEVEMEARYVGSGLDKTTFEKCSY